MLLKSGYRPNLARDGQLACITWRTRAWAAGSNRWEKIKRCRISRRPCTTPGSLPWSGLQYEAQLDGASGVVGTQIQREHFTGWDAHVIEFFCDRHQCLADRDEGGAGLPPVPGHNGE